VVAGFAGLTVFNAVTFYVGFVYLVSWLQTADGIPPSRSLEINTFSMVVSLPVLIGAGWLSDRIGRKPLMLFASSALPLFWLLNHPSELLAQLGQLGLVLLIGVYYGALPAVLVEAAPPRVRCTAVALGYNLCVTVRRVVTHRGNLAGRTYGRRDSPRVPHDGVSRHDLCDALLVS
jgi:MHS family proline/betaine transporter-like MFS transporter